MSEEEDDSKQLDTEHDDYWRDRSESRTLSPEPNLTGTQPSRSSTKHQPGHIYHARPYPSNAEMNNRHGMTTNQEAKNTHSFQLAETTIYPSIEQDRNDHTAKLSTGPRGKATIRPSLKTCPFSGSAASDLMNQGNSSVSSKPMRPQRPHVAGAQENYRRAPQLQRPSHSRPHVPDRTPGRSNSGGSYMLNSRIELPVSPSSSPQIGAAHRPIPREHPLRQIGHRSGDLAFQRGLRRAGRFLRLQESLKAGTATMGVGNNNNNNNNNNDNTRASPVYKVSKISAWDCMDSGPQLTRRPNDDDRHGDRDDGSTWASSVPKISAWDRMNLGPRLTRRPDIDHHHGDRDDGSSGARTGAGTGTRAGTGTATDKSRVGYAKQGMTPQTAKKRGFDNAFSNPVHEARQPRPPKARKTYKKIAIADLLHPN